MKLPGQATFARARDGIGVMMKRRVRAAPEPRDATIAQILSDAGDRGDADVLAPALLEIGRGHVELEGSFARTLAVIGYPRRVQAGWLAGLLDGQFPGEYVWHVKPMDNAAIRRKLQNRLASHEGARRFDVRQGKLPDPLRETAVRDLTALTTGLEMGTVRVFGTSLYVLLRAPTLDALDLLTRRVERALEGIQLRSRPALLEQGAAFESCLALGSDRLRVSQNLDTGSMATMFPFAASGLAQPGGVPWGVVPGAATPILVDLWHEDHENANVVVLGKGGGGKSYTSKGLALAQLLFGAGDPADDSYGTQLFVVDPEDKREYARATRAVGGQNVELGPSSRERFNPFDLPPRDRWTPDPVADQVSTLHALMNLLLAEPGGSVTMSERAVLDRCLFKTYSRVGIERASSVTWGRRPPLLSDLAEVLGAETGALAQSLRERLEVYVSGSFSGLFSGHTNIAANAPMVTFNTSRLSGPMLPVGTFLVTSYFWTQVRRRARPRLLIADEAWIWAQFPEGGRFLESMARRARKYWLGLVVITQAGLDVLNNDRMRAVMDNATFKILMRQDASSLHAIAEQLRLSAPEVNYLRGVRKREGLLIGPIARIPIRAEVSPAVHQLITTAPGEVAAIEAAEAAEDLANVHRNGTLTRARGPRP